MTDRHHHHQPHNRRGHQPHDAGRHQPHDAGRHRFGRRYLSDQPEQAPRPGWQRTGVSVLRWYALTIGIGVVLIILLTALRAALPVVILAGVAIYIAIQFSGHPKPPPGGHRAGRGSED